MNTLEAIVVIAIVTCIWVSIFFWRDRERKMSLAFLTLAACIIFAGAVSIKVYNIATSIVDLFLWLVSIALWG